MQKYIQNKNLIWLNIRKESRKNLRFKLKKHYHLLQTNPVSTKTNKINSIFFYNFLFQYLIKKGKRYTLEVLFKKNLIFWMLNYNKKFFSILESAFKNLILHVGILTKRKGSKNIYIPYKLPKKKTYFFAIKWLLENSLIKKKKNFFEALFEELMDCSIGTSLSIKKKEELLKLAENNLRNIRRKK